MRNMIFVSLLALAASSATAADTRPERTPEQLQASLEAHKATSITSWATGSSTADSQQYGKFGGLWSAVRLPEGQILDEYRIVGDDGRTIFATITLRNYNRTMERWELVGADFGSGFRNMGTASRAGSEMHIEQTFTGGEKVALWRIRYYDIQSDRFSWTADQSTDGGKTWVKKFMQLEARRIGPPRTRHR